MSRTLSIVDLGLVDYSSAWDLQKKLHRQLIDNSIEDTLILAEHPPVITCGRSSKTQQILTDRETLKQKKIDLYEIERGGAVTFHGPGQLVCYPIINLKHHKTDVGWYMRQLEQVVINLLARFAIIGLRNSGYTGVWVEEKNTLSKIAAIGVRLSRWCSMHGFAINVLNNLAGFEYIIPCGIDKVSVTCLESLLNQVQLGEYNQLADLFNVCKQYCIEDFSTAFNYN